MWSWDLLIWWTSYSFCLVLLIFKGEDPAYKISLRGFNVGSYFDTYRPISFKVGMTGEITKLYILISVWMALTFIHGHSCMRFFFLNPRTFHCRFQWSSVCCLNQLVCCSSLLDLPCTAIFKGENSADNFIKCTFNIVMCRDTYESICLKICVIQSTTKLYSLIPVWMTLMLTQGSRFTG